MLSLRRVYATMGLVVLLSNSKSCAVDIIIDLGGVLVKTDKWVAAGKIGMGNLVGHTLMHWKNPRKDFYTFLKRVKSSTQQSGVTHPVYDDQYQKLPCVMCDWLKGVSSKKILKRVNKAQPSKFNWKLAQTVFDPEIMSKSKQIVKEGVQFVQECRDRGYGVYVLANQDAETFEMLKAQFPDFFKLFSGIIISGDCKLLKPDPAIFNHLFTTYKLDPHVCFFIDDQRENIEIAQKLGLATYKINTKRATREFKKVRTALNSWIQKTNLPNK